MPPTPDERTARLQLALLIEPGHPTTGVLVRRLGAAETLRLARAEHPAVFGESMCLTSAYRTYEEQAALRRKKGGIAAPAGLSNHGWGLAVDFCSQTYTGERRDWLWDNAGIFGWENPEWAREGGSGYYEPWHWEYVPGVQAIAASGLG